METEATIGYGFLVDPENINKSAVTSTALEIYGDKALPSSPAELLREVALSHPDFDTLLSVSRTGDQSGFDDETMLLITARSTMRTAYVCGRISQPVEPTAEERKALSIFKERYVAPSEDEEDLYWALASSCD